MELILRIGEKYAPFKRYLGLLAVATIMCLYAVKQASAQETEPAATAVENIKPLQLGDTIPEYLWHLPLQVISHPERRDNVTLDDYRGKLIILDFWSTWCSTCIAGMPKMFGIGKELKDDVVVIPITYQDRTAIVPFANRNPVISEIPDFFSIVGDSVLRVAFDISGLPNSGIIGRDGRVSAIVRPRYITADKLSLLIRDPGAIAFPLTRNMEDIKGGPLLVPTFGAANLQRPVYYSALISHMPGLVAHDLFEADSAAGTVRYFIAHKQLLELYAMAVDAADIGFDRFPNRRILQHGVYDGLIPPSMRYETRGGDRLEWEKQYLFNYEYVGPIGRGREELILSLRHDLNRFFGVEARIAKRTVQCLILQKKKSEGIAVGVNGGKGHRPLRSLVNMLNDKRYELPPVLDGTGEAEWLRINLPANTAGHTAVNKALEAHGLTLVPATRELEMFILGKPGFNPPEPLHYTLSEYGYISNN